MKDISISEKLNMQFYKCNKLLKRSIFEQKMEHIKATPYKGQGKILRLLLENGDMLQKDIVIEMDIRPSTACELINKLERVGFVQKEINQKDKRGTIIMLTESGRREAAKAKWDLNNMSSELFSVFNREEQEILSGYLDRLIVSLKKTEQNNEDDSELYSEFEDAEMEYDSSFRNNFRSELKDSGRKFKRFFKEMTICGWDGGGKAKPKIVEDEETVIDAEVELIKKVNPADEQANENKDSNDVVDNSSKE